VINLFRKIGWLGSVNCFPCNQAQGNKHVE